MPPASPAPRALMFQGTGSDVGKSLLVAGLARAFTRRGLRVRPFKPQNMSNNAAVTPPSPDCPQGGEIGRAQALQARACGVPPSVLMNPILLKPQSDVGSQVVVCGTVLGNAKAADYHRLKPSLLPRVLDSFHRLASEADLVLVEGAGSAAEVNLRAADIANMGFAEAADLPVILIGDIDRGGVLAQVVGTHVLLPTAEQQRIKGFVINKFRGDPALFADGMALMTERTGWAACGLLPWFPDAARLPPEDGMALDTLRPSSGPRTNRLRVVVPRLSRIANFDDLDPLRAEPSVEVIVIPPGQPLPLDADVILLPGSKATRADLAFLRLQGWDIDLLAHYRRGGRIVGLCAGYQMLGETVFDPDGLEGRAGETPGLGLLPLSTTITRHKTLTETSAHDELSGCRIQGYEMHMGQTIGPGLASPWLRLDGRPEGSISPDGQVMGCYIHGLFASDAYRAHLLAQWGRPSTAAYEQGVEAALDALADHLERHMDLSALLALATPVS